MRDPVPGPFRAVRAPPDLRSTHLPCRATWTPPDGLPSRRQRGGPQAVNQAQDVGEQASRGRGLGKLERDRAALADHLGANLDQLYTKRDQLRLRIRFEPPAASLGRSAPELEADEIGGTAEVTARRPDFRARAGRIGEAARTAAPSQSQTYRTNFERFAQWRGSHRSQVATMLTADPNQTTATGHA